ncbi:MAG: ABC transporter substrate-binding protein [Deltaproteobacteria bacterium]|nr:ABC transporter substrate-binding protein [Deltaproteobacteria bacterium]
MKFYKVAIIAIALTLFIFTGTNVKAETLKVGVISVLSGPGAVWGLGILRGAEMATSEVNDRGGLKVNGKTYKIELIAYDDKYTGKGGKSACEKLVYRDKVKFIIGPISSASLLAFQEMTEKEKILVLSDSYTDKALSPQKPFTLRVFMTAIEATPLLVDWVLKEYPNTKKVITIAPNDASGHAGAKVQESAYKKHGIELASKEFYERGTKDFSPLVTRAQMLNPDVIAFANAPTSDCALMVKLFRQMGSHAVFTDNTSTDFRKMVKIIGKKAAEGYIWGAFFDPADPKMKGYNERFKKRYNIEIPSYVDPAFYQAAKAFYYAIEKAQSLDPATVRDTIKYRIPEFESVMGKMVFGGKETYGIDNQVYSAYYASVIKDGKQVILKKLR